MIRLHLNPTNDRIVVRPYEPEQKTKGGLILAEKEDARKPQYAEVIAIGPGTADNPVVVEVGDKVIFSRLIGTEVKVDGETLIIVRQKDILGVIE